MIGQFLGASPTVRSIVDWLRKALAPGVEDAAYEDELDDQVRLGKGTVKYLDQDDYRHVRVPDRSR